MRRLTRNPAFATSPAPALAPDLDDARDRPHFAQSEWDGRRPTASMRSPCTWTPTGTSKAEAQRYPVIDRYIAAVDVNGVISTGHAALESPEGIYISLYPGVEIDRSPDEFTRILRATRENDVPGLFQPDYATESKAWCPSTVRVRIRNYDPSKLDAFWTSYRQNLTYNLTHRNCSSTVSNALEAALDGAVWRLKGARAGWGAFVRLLLTPELWVAAQIRKRAVTMAWTPAHARLCARAQHARRPAAVRVVEGRALGREGDHGVAPHVARAGPRGAVARRIGGCVDEVIACRRTRWRHCGRHRAAARGCPPREPLRKQQ